MHHQCCIEINREQTRLKEELILQDVDDWAKHHIMEDSPDFPGMRPLQYIAGVDISFVKDDNVNACAAFVVVDFPELKVKLYMEALLAILY